MDERLPLSLKVVAGVFVLGGLVALVQVVLAAASADLRIDPMVLGIFIGRGLLHRSYGWYRWAKGFTILFLLAGLAVAFLALVGTGTVTIGSATRPADEVRLQGALLGAVILGLAIWQLRVLMGPHARRLYRPPDPWAGRRAEPVRSPG